MSHQITQSVIHRKYTDTLEVFQKKRRKKQTGFM